MYTCAKNGLSTTACLLSASIHLKQLKTGSGVKLSMNMIKRATVRGKNLLPEGSKFFHLRVDTMRTEHFCNGFSN